MSQTTDEVAGGASCAGKSAHTSYMGAAEFVALAAPVEPPTSPLHAKHPTRECKTFHTHQAQHTVWGCREEPYACETCHADMESKIQALLSSLPSGK